MDWQQVSEMLAARFLGNQRMAVEKFPDPQIEKPDECLVRVMACGICGSDRLRYLAPAPQEQILGHEAAGEVIAVGDEVPPPKQGTGLRSAI